MSFIYITGAPGSGKTTIHKELSRRGYRAYDLDDYGGPHNKNTGKLVVMPTAEKRSPEWFDAHEWRIDLEAIEKPRLQAYSEKIFMCGVAASDPKILHLFDRILYLALDDEVLRDRIASRTKDTGDYGKNDFEVQEIVKRKHSLDAKYLSSDVVKIDATKSLDDVVDEILLNT